MCDEELAAPCVQRSPNEGDLVKGRGSHFKPFIRIKRRTFKGYNSL